MTNPTVALVTGASRGAGKGIALALGEKSMTVYVTGRSEKTGEARGWDGSPLPGTIHDTAEAISKAGGTGIAVKCDHNNDGAVAELFDQIQSDHGRLDILVNNAAYMHPQLIEDRPFWEKEIDAVGILDVGLRSAYIASWHAAKMMAAQRSGLITFTSSFGATCYMHGPAYGAQKAGVDKLAHDMAVDLKPVGVNALSLWLGPQLTERALIAAEVNPEQYKDFIAMAETPQFVGDIVHRLASDPDTAELSGQTIITAEIAEKWGLRDRNGKQPPSHRKMLGDPRPPNPAIIK
ncbi:MAG: SDR family NAD(P)-dependent oxidoreductase [Pseudomonadota bacterium]